VNIRESLEDSLRRIEAYTRAGVFIKKALDEIASVENGKQQTAVPENLTPREREIYLLLREGLDAREIAEKLGRSLKTIEAQRDTLRKKLGFKTSKELTDAVREKK